MPYGSSTAFKAKAAAGNYARDIKVEYINFSTGAVTGTLPSGVLNKGTVQVKAQDEGRRTASLEILNDTGAYTPHSSSDPFFMNNAIRISYGIHLDDGTWEYCPLGTFLVNKSGPMRSAKERILYVDLMDYWKKLQVTKLQVMLNFSAGSAISGAGKAIDTLLSLAGFTTYQTDAATQALAWHPAPGADTNYGRGESLADCFSTIADSFSLDFWFDQTGLFSVKRGAFLHDLTADAAVGDFTDTAQGIIKMKGSIEDSPLIANWVKVFGSSPDTIGICAEVKDNNPASLTYVNGPMGVRYKEIVGEYYKSVGMATDAAYAELRRNIFLAKKEEVTTLPFPWYDAFDVVTLTDSDFGDVAAKYYLESTSIDLVGGAQTFNLLNVRPLA